MLNCNELDKNYKVEIRRNSYGYLYHFNEVIPSDIKTISVSESYRILKENHTIFIPVLEDIEILKIIYELNENLFPNSNINRRVLYIKGLETKTPWKIDIEYPIIKNFTIKDFKTERKLANYLLGYLHDEDITNSDDINGNKETLLRVLKLEKIKLKSLHKYPPKMDNCYT